MTDETDTITLPLKWSKADARLLAKVAKEQMRPPSDMLRFLLVSFAEGGQAFNRIKDSTSKTGGGSSPKRDRNAEPDLPEGKCKWVIMNGVKLQFYDLKDRAIFNRKLYDGVLLEFKWSPKGNQWYALARGGLYNITTGEPASVYWPPRRWNGDGAPPVDYVPTLHHKSMIVPIFNKEEVVAQWWAGDWREATQEEIDNPPALWGVPDGEVDFAEPAACRIPQMFQPFEASPEQRKEFRERGWDDEGIELYEDLRTKMIVGGSDHFERVWHIQKQVDKFMSDKEKKADASRESWA